MGLIDDLVQGLGKEVSSLKANIEARSQKMIKTYNLGQELRELEQRKTEQLAAIGRLICDKYERQIDVNEESLQKQCQEITALEKDIAQLQMKLDKLKTDANPDSPSSASAEPK